MLKRLSKALITTWIVAMATACTLSLEITSQIPTTKPLTEAYNPAVGVPDLSFGGTGFIQHKITQDLDMADIYGSLTRDSEDNIYLVGDIGSRNVVRALNPDGSVKTEFAKDGYFFTGFQFNSGDVSFSVESREPLS